jgi:predicted CXXCH cytochrome family protein
MRGNVKQAFMITVFLLTGLAISNNGFTAQPHEFSNNDCAVCHVDEKNAPEKLHPRVTDECLNCHTRLDTAFCHPIDKYPYQSTATPEDMPLTEGKLTCLTCHYAHPGKGAAQKTFVRRETTGPSFCMACHLNDKREHVNIGTAHVDPYKTKSTGTLDGLTFLCIECHDNKLSEKGELFGIQTCLSKLNHAVGISYERGSLKKAKEYRPAGMLDKNISLFDGKLGCGTCHNIYSEIRYLLVMDNHGSKLCLECHVK